MKASNLPTAPKREDKTALSVLDQMFAYYSYETPPLARLQAEAA